MIAGVPSTTSDGDAPVTRAEAKASVGARVSAHLPFANLETRRVADSRGAVTGQRVVLLWNELGHGTGVDGRAENRLLIA